VRLELRRYDFSRYPKRSGFLARTPKPGALGPFLLKQTPSLAGIPDRAMKTTLPQPNSRTSPVTSAPASQFADLTTRPPRAPAGWLSGRSAGLPTFVEAQPSAAIQLLESPSRWDADVLSTPATAPSNLRLDGRIGGPWGSGEALLTGDPQDTLIADSNVSEPGKQGPSFYMSLPGCSASEGFVLGLVTGAAFVGIAYGFLCGVHLVQNWALFGSGIARLLQ